MFIDVAQARNPQVVAKLVEQPHIRNGALVGQVGKAAPVALFGQHLDQQVEGMSRREQGQQMDSIQLGRAEAPVPSAPQGTGPQLVHKPIGPMRGTFPEPGGCARQRKQRFHALRATPRKLVRPQKSSPPTCSAQLSPHEHLALNSLTPSPTTISPTKAHGTSLRNGPPKMGNSSRRNGALAKPVKRIESLARSFPRHALVELSRYRQKN